MRFSLILVALLALVAGCTSSVPPTTFVSPAGENLIAATILPTTFISPTPSPIPPLTTFISPTPRPLLWFDGQRAYEHVLAQCALGPRPTGSQAGWATGDYIISTLRELGWPVQTQEFTYRGVRARNILAGPRGSGPAIIVGAHYDTRPRADRDPQHPDQPILGANDGASGVAVLLELARVLEEKRLQYTVYLAFFDAEDRGHLEGWPFSVGASYMAGHLEELLPTSPEVVIVVDMVGDAQQELYMERNSDAEWTARIWKLAAELGYEEFFIADYRWTIMDDHVPFIKQNIPAVDIIDFDYPHWHTLQDTADKVSPESLARVGLVLQHLVYTRVQP